jgi:hypothetical protein
VGPRRVGAAADDGGGGFGGFAGLAVNPGTYRVVLTVDGKEMSQNVRVEADPDAPPSVLAEGEEQDRPQPGREGVTDDDEDDP